MQTTWGASIFKVRLGLQGDPLFRKHGEILHVKVG